MEIWAGISVIDREVVGLVTVDSCDGLGLTIERLDGFQPQKYFNFKLTEWTIKRRESYNFEL